MPRTKDYQLEFRRFISSQHLYTGIRLTFCVILPAWLLYHFGLLTAITGVPLGALFVGLTDNPGPIHHRRNGMLVSAFLNFIVVLIAGLSRFHPWLIGTEIAFFGIFCSLIAVFGTRASSVGLAALLIFILGINNRIPPGNVLEMAAYYLTGGLWYTAVSLSISSLRPFKPVQQLLGECLMKTSSYLMTRGSFYNLKADSSEIVGQLIEQQVRIHQYQEQLRAMLFTTRRFISESTSKGRILTMMFRDSIDLFERAINNQPEYELLHKEFDGTGILEIFHKSINTLAGSLYNTGLAVQEGNGYMDDNNIRNAIQESTDAFANLRKEKLKPENVEAFIKLRHVLNSLQDVADRIRRMQLYTTFDRNLSRQFKNDVDFSKFTTHQEINLNLLLSNFSLDSFNFRHALRLTIALLTGYLLSLFFPLGHGYWILLTIATIIKPAYSLTRQRNIQRLSGTFAGATVGFVILFSTHNNTIIFIFMLAMMIMAYSLLRVNYAVSIAGLTIYLLLSFHFLYPGGLNSILFDRVIDTVIGSVIAYIVAYFVLPAWEHEQIEKLMVASLKADKDYFLTVAKTFTGDAPDETSYKIARKQAFVTLANLSDNFQRMLSDPKNQQPNLPLYHQFVTADHMLASHIATLSNNAQQFGTAYQHSDFQPLINSIDKTFGRIDTTEEEQGTAQADIQANPVLQRVKRLIEQRKKDLQQGLETTPAETRKTLSELVSITDEFRLINSVAADAVKIFREIKTKSH
ncbi:MAG: FUSC family protein [Chitinophagaceae bacterium]|nr:FUSC family protein [Chitinophagaceae bacterium]